MTSPFLHARLRHALLIVCLGALGPGAGSCGGGGDGKDVPDAASADPSLLPARQLYRVHCSACHGRNGEGAKNLFPPLIGPTWVVGDPGRPIRIVLHGLEGTLSLGGAVYMNRMPPLGARLGDGEVASILTYVRASWGNRAPPVAPQEVADIRAETSTRDRPYRVEELAD